LSKSIESASTTGLTASKKCRCAWPTNAATSAASASDVSGPVATIVTGASGICSTSQR
jgi:hypothetical protein